MLQAYIDESESDGVLVLAGYAAIVPQWKKFSEEWGHALRGMGNIKSFKMSSASDERPELIGHLANIIRSNVYFAFYTAVRISDVNELIPTTSDFDYHRNPYMLSFFILISRILQDPIVQGQKIEFIFDERSEKKKIRKAWSEFMRHAPPNALQAILRKPRFENEEDQLPLQAADFAAWWTRRRFLEFLYDDLEKKPAPAKQWKLPTIAMNLTPEVLRQFVMRSGYPTVEQSPEGGMVIRFGRSSFGIMPTSGSG